MSKDIRFDKSRIETLKNYLINGGLQGEKPLTERRDGERHLSYEDSLALLNYMGELEDIVAEMARYADVREFWRERPVLISPALAMRAIEIMNLDHSS